MASAVGNIFIGLHVDTTGTRALGGMADSVVRQSHRMRQSLNGTGRSVAQLRSHMAQGYRSRLFDQMLRQATSVNNELGRMRAALLGVAAITGTPIAGAMTGAWLLQTADRAHLLRNQLATVTDSHENLLAVQERLYDLSQRTRSEMSSTVMIYARTARAVEHLGKSQEDLVRVTETIQKAFAIGGASQAEATGAAIQLSQGIASDRFSGEEYRSVAENAPVLLRGMADALGVNIGKLREMAHAGELTGEVVTNAILKASGKIDVAFEKVGVTAAQAFTRLSNSFLMYAGEVDTSVGATRALAGLLTNVAENFAEVVKWAGALAAIIGGPILGRMAGRAGGRAVAGTAGWLGLMGSGEEGLQARKILEERVKLQKELVAMGARVGPGGRMTIAATASNIAQMKDYNAKLRDYNALTARAAVATQTLAQQQRVLAVAGRVGGSVLGFLGGWTGVAFLGAIAALGTMTAHMAGVQERTRSLKEELHSLGMITDEVAGIVEKTSKSLDELAADQLRAKLREIRQEMERFRGEQNPFEKLFGFDTQQLGNIETQLQQLTSGWMRHSTTETDKEAAAELLEIVKQLRAGEVVPGLGDRLDQIARSSPDLAASIDSIITNLRLGVPYMEALAARAEELEASLGAVARGPVIGSQFMEDINSAIEERLDLERRLADVAGEMTRVAGLSEEEARIEKIVEALKKQLELEGEIDAATRKTLVTTARQTAADEDHAKALKEIKDLRDSMNADGLTLVDRDAVARINDLLDQFEAGNMRVETMKAAMAEIANLRLSKTMDGLVEKIIAAIPQLATLLGIAQSFPGVSGPVHGRGAVGRARRELAGKREVGAKSVDEAIRVAGLGERDSFIESKAKELIDDAKELGGALSMEAAKEGAANIWELEQSLKANTKASEDAADAAKKFAEGMAELQAEAALAPLGDFVEAVYETAEGMGVSKAELQAFIDAVSSGGLDAAPQKFRDIADAMREIKYVNIMDDLQFEQAQMFRVGAEREIHQTLRGTGIDINSAQGEMIAGQIRFNELLSETKDIALGFAQTFRSALSEGKSWWEALGEAGVNALDQIAAKLMEMAVMGMLQQVIGMAFGGGMGFSPQLGQGLTGPAVFGGSNGFFMGNFAEGGGGRIPGAGPPDSVWAYARVTPGEPYAFGEQALRGLAGGGMGQVEPVKVHVTVGVSTDGNGNIRPFVESVSREEVGRFSKHELPGRMAKIQSNPGMA